MPKILVDASKGLHQTSGNSTTNGTIAGHKKHVVTSDGALTLANSDSGKFFVLGTTGGAITFPMTQGWNAEFLLTGSISADYVISGSDQSTILGAGAVVTGSHLIIGKDGSPAGVAGVSANDGKIKFEADNAREGDTIKVNVVSTNRVQFHGICEN